MKRKLLFGAVAGLSLAASAQVSVNRHGQIVVGNTGLGSTTDLNLNNSTSTNGIGSGAIIPGYWTFQADSLAKICVVGDQYRKTGGYITFGDRSDVSIGEYGSPTTDFNILRLVGTGGLRYENGNGTVFTYTGTGNTFRFNCNVTVDGVSVTSDSRLKSDIQDLSGTVGSLSGITPVSYTLSMPGASGAMKASASESADEEMSPRVPADERERFGFIAQEVREVFPQLVSEDENGYLAVDYIGFIPILVDAVKELSAKVDEQQEIIASLSDNRPSRKKGTAGVEDVIDTVASMSQNNPNPFNQTTVIGVTLPEDVAEAYICIYDLQGKQMLRLPVEGRGQTSVEVDGSRLSAGMYIYTLIADGQEVATKRMILTE